MSKKYILLIMYYIIAFLIARLNYSYNHIFKTLIILNFSYLAIKFLPISKLKKESKHIIYLVFTCMFTNILFL